MIKKTIQITLDLKRVTAQAASIPPLVVGDNGNEFVITLTDSGEAVNLSGCKVIAVFSKVSDGSTVEQDTEDGSVTIGGTGNNVITISPVRATSFGNGKNNCEIQIYSGDNNDVLVTSAQFNFDGRMAIMNGETIQAEDKYPILVQLIAQVHAAIAEIETRVGDMTKAVYDPDEDGKVLAADDADSLGGTPAEDYALRADIPTDPEDVGAAPASHASNHGTAGVDPITPASIGAAAAGVQAQANLTTAGWTASGEGWEQTASASGATADNNVVVSPAPGYFDEYGNCGVRCTHQYAGQLKFYAVSKPESAIGVNILIVG